MPRQKKSPVLGVWKETVPSSQAQKEGAYEVLSTAGTVRHYQHPGRSPGFEKGGAEEKAKHGQRTIEKKLTSQNEKSRKKNCGRRPGERITGLGGKGNQPHMNFSSTPKGGRQEYWGAQYLKKKCQAQMWPETLPNNEEGVPPKKGGGFPTSDKKGWNPARLL